MSILAGTTTIGTQAAVEYVCEKDSLEELLRNLSVRTESDVKPSRGAFARESSSRRSRWRAAASRSSPKMTYCDSCAGCDFAWRSAWILDAASFSFLASSSRPKLL